MPIIYPKMGREEDRKNKEKPEKWKKHFISCLFGTKVDNHEIATVSYLRWQQIMREGGLTRLAGSGFECLLSGTGESHSNPLSSIGPVSETDLTPTLQLSVQPHHTAREIAGCVAKAQQL